MDPLVGEGHEIGVSNHVVKVIEVLAESPHSWEDAARVALREASRTLHNITSIYIKDMQAVVRDGHVSAWRVNTKVSFIVDDQTIGGTTMRYRQHQENVPEGNYRPSRDERSAYAEYDDYGLHGEDRRQYRGRESYEQQTRGGDAGRSGMWDHRFVPRDLDEPYRNHADEDRRGYQDIGRRQEFESGTRHRHYRQGEDDYSRTDYGRRDYHAPRGSYHGETRRPWRPPKGYERSDDRIREDVCDRLSHRYDVDATEVEVNVSNREVTLTGTVSDRDQKFQIEHIADAVGGVSEVHNQIRVRREIPLQSAGTTSTAPNPRTSTSQTRSS